MSTVFEDWINMSEASLRMLPVHAEHIAERGCLADDDEKTKALFARLHQQYNDKVFQHLGMAFTALAESIEREESRGKVVCGDIIYQDILGALYMEFGHPNQAAGQFFTPWHLCKALALGILGDHPQDLIYDRIRECLKENLLYQAIGSPRINDDTAQSLVSMLAPVLAEHYEPLTIADPCIGSGGMLLAAAELFPRWVVISGLVQFFGQDIDPHCIAMARINAMLYGLNGYGLRLHNAGVALQDKLQLPVAKTTTITDSMVDITIRDIDPGQQLQLTL